MSKIILGFIVLFYHVTLNSQWVYQQTPTNATHYLTIEFPSTQIGIAGGTTFNPFVSGRGAFTTNAGNSWFNSQVPDTLRVIVEIKFVSTTTGYSACAYNVNQTNSVNITKYDRTTFRALRGHFDAGDDYKGLFMKSTNSGQSWFTFGTLPSNVYYLLGLHFVNQTTGFAIASYDYSGGVNDGVIKTTNGGLTWTVLILPQIINTLEDIFFLDINSGYAVGYDEVNDSARGVILRTTNSGLSWSRQIFTGLNQFNGIHFSNSSTGLAVGGSNSIIEPAVTKIYRTTNAGLNWSFVFNFDEKFVYDISFVSGTGTALIYGDEILGGLEQREFISRTTNYGSSWTQSLLNDTGLILLGAELLDQNNWYLTGGDFSGSNNPVILHTTNGGAIGITPIGSEIPEGFVLSQNYPNPFNPITNIKFQIPKSSFVKLVVYDLLGREITMLVDEQLKAGTYEADWDATNYPSGVYFYKLISDEYIETKKMVLIK